LFQNNTVESLIFLKNTDKRFVSWINKFLNYILFFSFAACISIFGYVYYSYTTQKQIELKRIVDSKKPTPDELVNKYLKQGSLELNRQKLESLNKIRSNVIDDSVAKTKMKEVSPEAIPIEMQIAKDKSISTSNGQGLSDEFNQKYNQYLTNQIADAQYRKEYAKQFIENARKNGYHITLSDEMEVTSVKPIRQPTNQNDTESFESQPSN